MRKKGLEKKKKISKEKRDEKLVNGKEKCETERGVGMKSEGRVSGNKKEKENTNEMEKKEKEQAGNEKTARKEK